MVVAMLSFCLGCHCFIDKEDELMVAIVAVVVIVLVVWW